MATPIATAATINVPYTPPPNANVPGFMPLYQHFLLGRQVLVPKNGLQQIGCFIFDYTGDESVVMSNTVTDNWLEDNVAVQDHIAVQPTQVTFRGFVSELVLSKTIFNLVSGTLIAAENSLSTLPAYLGRLTPGATDALLNAIQQAENVAVQLERAATIGAQLYNIFATPKQWDKQQTAFAQLSAYRLARTVFSVLTPYQVFDNMTITNLTARQSAQTKTMSDFSVTLKQLNFTDAQASFSKIQSEFLDASSNAGVVENGTTAGSATLLGPIAGF